MSSRLTTVMLLLVSPLLLACGTWGELWISGEDEQQALLTICDPDDEIPSKMASCNQLKSRLDSGETLVVQEGWFNFFLAQGDLLWNAQKWRSQMGDGALVNRIIPGSDGQWIVEMWLLQDQALHPITDVFPYRSKEFWEILDVSIFTDAIYSEAVIAASVRIPVDNDSGIDNDLRDDFPKSQVLLELFNGNHLVFTGSIEVNVRITRSCVAGLEDVFGQALTID
ncbi:MAG: hypothetical protein F6J87_13000 [Spirulina sp. SIO3F2]|nr:hypothetical protein [Spirulina sp. SIO3F2]